MGGCAGKRSRGRGACCADVVPGLRGTHVWAALCAVSLRRLGRGWWGGASSPARVGA
jgi:hypothetical protein